VHDCPALKIPESRRVFGQIDLIRPWILVRLAVISGVETKNSEVLHEIAPRGLHAEGVANRSVLAAKDVVEAMLSLAEAPFDRTMNVSEANADVAVPVFGTPNTHNVRDIIGLVMQLE